MSERHPMLYPELLAPFDTEAVVRDGRRLDHAEATSKPLRSRPEPQPRGAKVHGSRPIDQAEAAARFIAAPEHEKMHDERLWDLRQKRDREMHGIAEWEELRALASAIKEHTLIHLDQYLEQFEANARSNGIHVHWAKDAAEHNQIVHGILSDHGAKLLIKSKSMLTEECGFRHYMASVGIEVIETDLGERIQQLDNEDPSHVVVPAVHKLRTDVYSNLPFASTLNGSCSNVCPVKINIHEQIYAWRRELVKRHEVAFAKKTEMKAAGELLSRPAAYRAAIAAANVALAHLPQWVIYNGLNAWGRHREVPHPPKQTFHSWYQTNRGEKK